MDWILEQKKDLYIVTGVMYNDRDKPDYQCDLKTGDFIGPGGEVLGRKLFLRS